MYYIVKSNKKTYVSKEIIKHVRKIGDAGLVREIANGTIKQTQLLSVNLYELTKDELAALDPEAMGIQTQDLDAVCKTFTSDLNGKEQLTKQMAITWKYGDYTFIELRNLLYAKKYVVQDQLPIMDVCGTRYIAVNAAKKDSDKYISL